MKKLSIIISIIVGIIVIGTAIDRKYSHAAFQQYIMEQKAIHKLEHQEEVLQKRYFDLSRRYGETPTHEEKLEVEKSKAEWEQKQKEVNLKHPLHKCIFGIRLQAILQVALRKKWISY